MTLSTDKYIHTSEVHNLTSPAIIVPYIIDLLEPKSVVDIGCGTGTFLKVFKEQGIKQVCGVDGKWVNVDQLHIDADEFIEADLEKPFHLNSNFDVAMCLEVAEHLSSNASDTIIETLVSLSKKIIFSAAVPYQGGQNHINEQPISYWQKKFQQHGYYFYDVFRNQFWNNENVDWWYKQNMFLVLHESSLQSKLFVDKKVIGDVLLQIHPDLLKFHVQQKHKAVEKLNYLKNKVEKIKKGEEVWLLYGSMLLKKFKLLFKK